MNAFFNSNPNETIMHSHMKSCALHGMVYVPFSVENELTHESDKRELWHRIWKLCCTLARITVVEYTLGASSDGQQKQ